MHTNLDARAPHTLMHTLVHTLMHTQEDVYSEEDAADLRGSPCSSGE